MPRRSCRGGGEFALDEFPHPHHAIVEPNSSGSPTVVAKGLIWDQPEVQYIARGALCLPTPAEIAQSLGHPPPPATNVVITWSASGFDVFVAHGDGDHVTQTCRRFRDYAPRDHGLVTANAKVLSTDGQGTILAEKTFYYKVLSGGGPLRVESVLLQRYEDTHGLVHHRTPPGSMFSQPFLYPHYLVDFDYDPFDYRVSAVYKFGEVQTVSIFRVKPHWTQPSDIKVVLTVDGPLTLVNQDNELATTSGSPDAKKTRKLAATTYALVSGNGQDHDSGTGTVRAQYIYDPGPPNGEPPTPLTGISADESEKYWPTIPNSDVGDAAKYCQFKLHKPTSVTEYTNGGPVWEPPPGYTGQAYTYKLADGGGIGMPGVYIQERFWIEPPPWANINVYTEWTTVRKGVIIDCFNIPADDDGVMDGPDYLRVTLEVVSLKKLELHGHEYWAGTTGGAREGALYPKRQIPGTTDWAWEGVFLQCFFIVINMNPPGGASHDPETRHSPPIPPN